jgi:predicted NUDIX family NTP pyrophosphohydrolase
MKTSAGVLPFRRQSGLEVLIAHPGGPFFARKEEGAWSIVKGEVDAGETTRDAAIREFAEETGWVLPADAGLVDLGSVTLKSRKVVWCWAVEADFDPTVLQPGLFEMILRGRPQTFPEIDRVEWVSPDRAKKLLNVAQADFIDRLMATSGL